MQQNNSCWEWWKVNQIRYSPENDTIGCVHFDYKDACEHCHLETAVILTAVYSRRTK